MGRATCPAIAHFYLMSTKQSGKILGNSDKKIWGEPLRAKDAQLNLSLLFLRIRANSDVRGVFTNSLLAAKLSGSECGSGSCKPRALHAIQ